MVQKGKSIYNKLNDLIAGKPSKFEVEKRLFNIALILAIIVSILSIVINLNLKLPLILNLVIASGILLLTYIFIYSRFFKQFYIIPFIFISIVILSISWMLNDGAFGSINYLYILAFVIFLSISHPKHHLWISILIIVNLILLYSIQSVFPSLIRTYPDELARENDLMLTYAYVVVFSALIFSSMRKNYQNEKDKVEIQKSKIELQHKNITDSIQYAKEIQQALLQDKENVTKFFNDSFVFWLPKDIVSGDFYIFKEFGIQNEKVIAAVADFTGHGVPGALITIIGLSFFNEIALQHPQYSASEFLDNLKIKIKGALKQGNRSVENRDGMDIALVIYDKQSNTLEYAGANRPLFVLKNGNITEIKSDHMPVGLHYNDDSLFTNHKIQLNSGDVVYMFTDGYADQFGGKNVRKFYVSNFKKLILENSQKSLENQLSVFKKTFFDWKGEQEQTDDVLVVAFKIP